MITFPRLASWLFGRLVARVVTQRNADLVIGVNDPIGPYMYRWWLIPRNRVFNIYLHCFMRSDDDRALHDHPWFWCSFLLAGAYVEHTIKAGGIHARRLRGRGSLKFSSPRRAHRVELLRESLPLANGGLYFSPPMPCWTIFFTGPVMRRWGFHCAGRGWVDYADFTDAKNGKQGEIGAGCEG